MQNTMDVYVQDIQSLLIDNLTILILWSYLALSNDSFKYMVGVRVSPSHSISVIPIFNSNSELVIWVREEIRDWGSTVFLKHQNIKVIFFNFKKFNSVGVTGGFRLHGQVL